MSTPVTLTPADDRELVLGRILEAPREALWRCWTDPALLPQWFCPPPWRVSHAEMDPRPGGATLVVMQGPAGEEMRVPGLYLDFAPPERLVFTDAFTGAWEPSTKAFMVASIGFAPHPRGTLYTARVRHWTVEDRAAHEAMGFATGWGIATDQLEALAKTLA